MSSWILVVYYLTLTTLLYFPLSGTIGYITYLDFLIASVPNDALVNTYYFWWTNLHYVTPFWLVVLIIFSWGLGLNPSKIFYVTLLVLTEFWLTEFYLTLSSNTQSTAVTTLTPTVNLLLTNALNKYHPFVFYSSVYLTLLLVVYYSVFSVSTCRFLPNYLNSVLNNLTCWIVTLNFVSLLLGSWWAIQEGTWGGWWNWDSSELFGLLPSLLVLSLFHSTNSLAATSLNSMFINIFFSLIVLTYLLIQLNFELISHNFGAKFFFFFNSNLASLFSIMLILVLTRLLLTQFSQIVAICSIYAVIHLSSKVHLSMQTYLNSTLYVVLFFWFWVGFGEFFEYIVFSLTSFTVGTTNSIFLLNLLLLLLFTLFFTRFSNVLSFPLTFVTPVQIFYTLISPNTTSHLHAYLIYFTFITLVTYPLSIFIWLLAYQDFFYVFDTDFMWKSSLVYSCDTWNIDNTETWSDVTGQVALSWVTLDVTNIESLNSFILILTPIVVLNYYVLTNATNTVIILMVLPFVPSLLFSSLYVSLRLLGAR